MFPRAIHRRRCLLAPHLSSLCLSIRNLADRPTPKVHARLPAGGARQDQAVPANRRNGTNISRQTERHQRQRCDNPTNPAAWAALPVDCPAHGAQGAHAAAPTPQNSILLRRAESTPVGTAENGSRSCGGSLHGTAGSPFVGYSFTYRGKWKHASEQLRIEENKVFVQEQSPRNDKRTKNLRAIHRSL